MAPVEPPPAVPAPPDVLRAARDFIARVDSHNFTDPEGILVCAEWYRLRAAVKDAET